LLAGQVRGLFDFSISSPPAPGTGVPEFARLEPVAGTPDLLSGPMPEPEDRTPGPNVWVCRECRWPVPKPKIHCPRCGHVKTVNTGRATERGTVLILLLFTATILVFLLAIVIAG
jgi:hypothetical protein